MGIEYQVKLKGAPYALIDQAFRDCPFFDDYDKSCDMYNFRWGGSEYPKMPQAFAKIEQYGLYICLNGARTDSVEFVEYIRDLVVDKLGQPFDMDEI